MLSIGDNFNSNLTTSNEDVKIVSAAKISEFEQTVESIKKVHLSLNWSHYDKFIESDLSDKNKKTFLLISNKGEIMGYSSLKMGANNDPYLNMIAIAKDHQKQGLGMNLLLHTLRKAHKSGAEILTLEFRDNEKLRNYYTNPKIPYEKNYERGIGKFKDGELKNKITYHFS